MLFQMEHFTSVAVVTRCLCALKLRENDPVADKYLLNKKSVQLFGLSITSLRRKAFDCCRDEIANISSTSRLANQLQTSNRPHVSIVYRLINHF